MLHFLLQAWQTYGLHPLIGRGYQWWSGIGSVFTPKDIAYAAVAYTYLRSHNCHVPRCPRLQWHIHPDHGHPVCKKHHPHDPTTLVAA